jgi:vitamin B12 transporter
MKYLFNSVISANPPCLFFSLVILIFFFFVTPVDSQTSDTLSRNAVVTIPPTIITATRIPTIPTAVNRAYEILHPSDVSAGPLLSMDEVLLYSSLGGGQSRGIFGIQTDMSIRGSTFSQNLVLLNGQRLNDPQTGHHTLDLPVTVDDIDRIEIVKGHASTQYGADAYAGVLNIITKHPTGEKFTLRIGGGEYGLLTALASLTTGGASVNSRNTFEIKKADGFRDDTEFTIWSMTTLNDVRVAGERYSLNGGYTKKKFGAFDFYSPGRNAASKEKTSVGWLTVETEFGGGFVRIHPRVYLRRHDDEFIYTPGSRPNTHTTYAGGGEITGTVSIGRIISVLLGAEGNWDRITSTSLGNHHRSTISLFGILQTSLDENVSFDLGMRYDRNSKYGEQFSPSIGLGYLFRESTKIFVSAGRSFRAPSYTDLYYNDPSNSGNPDLIPEIGWSYEFGMRNTSLPDINMDGAIFFRDQTALIDYVQYTETDVYHAVNFTRAMTRGGEYGIEWSSAHPETDGDGNDLIRTIAVNYTYLDSHIDRGDNYRTKYSLNHPRHAISSSVSMHLPERIDISMMVAWKKRMEDEYTVIDISVCREFTPVNVFLKVQNILNTRYEEIIGVPQAGRWIWGGIEIGLKRFH